MESCRNWRRDQQGPYLGKWHGGERSRLVWVLGVPTLLSMIVSFLPQINDCCTVKVGNRAPTVDTGEKHIKNQWLSSSPLAYLEYSVKASTSTNQSTRLSGPRGPGGVTLTKACDLWIRHNFTSLPRVSHPHDPSYPFQMRQSKARKVNGPFYSFLCLCLGPDKGAFPKLSSECEWLKATPHFLSHIHVDQAKPCMQKSTCKNNDACRLDADRVWWKPTLEHFLTM